jgi:hypothetical protein
MKPNCCLVDSEDNGFIILSLTDAYTLLCFAVENSDYDESTIRIKREREREEEHDSSRAFVVFFVRPSSRIASERQRMGEDTSDISTHCSSFRSR